MRDRAEIVVVGAGIMGLAIAYHLARLGVTRRRRRRQELPLRRRQRPERRRRARAVVERGEHPADAGEHPHVPRLRVRDEDQRLVPPGRLPVPRAHRGQAARARGEREAPERVRPRHAHAHAGGGPRHRPRARHDGVVAASYNPDDGVVFPWPFVWGFAQAARKLGVEVATFTEVVGFETHGARIDGRGRRATSRRERQSRRRTSIETHKVVNACGAWSPAIARMLGVELPNKPHRHEILLDRAAQALAQAARRRPHATASTSASRRAARSSAASGRSASRTGLNQESSFAFLGKYARALTRACPVLGDVKVLRQWAGCYDLTPDANPIVGEVDEVEGFFQASGFMGHGFMMAPVMGKRIAEQIVAARRTRELFKRWNLRRFKEGKLLSARR